MSKKKQRSPVHADLPDPEEIYSVFKKEQRPLRLDALLTLLDLPRRGKKGLEQQLDLLQARGRLLRLHGGAWTDTTQLRRITGWYTVTRSGAGFVSPDETNEHGKKRLPQDIFISPHQAGEAWHGDHVEVALSPSRSGKSPEGRIVRVLERRQKELAARVVHSRDGKALCRPADSRFNIVLEVDLRKSPFPVHKEDLLLLAPGKQCSPDRWQASVVSGMGQESAITVQERLVKLNHNVPGEFPPPVLREAEAFAAGLCGEDYKGREDVREIPFVTIDGHTARDFDDAIHVSGTARGWLLRVGIADVTHYLRPRSALDREAFERANSWYFPTSVEPMLPPSLSNGLCSLNPHVDRLIMLAGITFSETGEPQSTHFAPAVMRSAARLTYEQVAALLENGGDAQTALPADAQESGVLPMLGEARKLAEILASARTARGTLDFNLPEPEYHFDAQGRITDITRKKRLFSHGMIEEFMIAANEAVARFLESKGLDFLYRVHPEPERDRLESLFDTVKSTPLADVVPRKPAPSAIQHLLQAAHGTDQEFLIGRLALRAMPQARYQPLNEGHFGLASACYCHFTSPIRRYADVIVHRALKQALGIAGGATVPAHKLLRVADQLNRRERAAMEAEREIARRLGCLVLENRVGEVFDGTISSVNDFGVFVELDALPVEGMIRIDALGNDYFEYDPARQELTGVRTGQRFQPGQRASVRLASVNMERLEINLSFPGVRKRKGKWRDFAR